MGRWISAIRRIPCISACPGSGIGPIHIELEVEVPFPSSLCHELSCTATVHVIQAGILPFLLCPPEVQLPAALCIWGFLVVLYRWLFPFAKESEVIPI